MAILWVILVAPPPPRLRQRSKGLAPEAAQARFVHVEKRQRLQSHLLEAAELRRGTVQATVEVAASKRLGSEQQNNTTSK